MASKAQLFVGSPNRIRLEFPEDKFGMAVKVTDIYSGKSCELSLPDLISIANTESE